MSLKEAKKESMEELVERLFPKVKRNDIHHVIPVEASQSNQALYAYEEENPREHYSKHVRMTEDPYASNRLTGLKVELRYDLPGGLFGYTLVGQGRIVINGNKDDETRERTLRHELNHNYHPNDTEYQNRMNDLFHYGSSII